jgi:hypothetical protein
MSWIDDQVTLLAASVNLGVGDRSTHLRCPKCDDPRNTFVMWGDPEGVAFRCYRASCGLHGRVGARLNYSPGTKLREVTEAWKRLHPIPLPYDCVDWLSHKFRLKEEDIWLNGILWDEGLERVLLPITGIPRGMEGYLAREYPELQLREHRTATKAKAIFGPLPEGSSPSCLMKPWGAINDLLVITEDYWSAVRVNEFIPACALSGTSVGNEAIRAILAAGVERLIFVLDADATNKARSLVRMHSLLFRQIGFVTLEGADPKDLSLNALQTQVIDPIRRLLNETTD